MGQNGVVLWYINLSDISAARIFTQYECEVDTALHNNYKPTLK